MLSNALIFLLKSIGVLNIFMFRNVPFRVRVRLARRRNEDEDSPHKFYTLVTHVPVDSFKGTTAWINGVGSRNLLLIFWVECSLPNTRSAYMGAQAPIVIWQERTKHVRV